MDRSRESTLTVGRESAIPVCYHPNGNELAQPEEVPDHLLDDPEVPAASKRLIIAVDFGTTYSAVAYVPLEEGESTGYLDPARIRTIQNYPNDTNFADLYDEMRSEVPTEVIYPLAPRSVWEADLDATRDDSDEDSEPHEDEVVSASARNELEAQVNIHSSLSIFDPLGNDDADRMSVDETTSFRWGYGAHDVWGRSATHADPTNPPLSRFKLLLDSGPRTEDIRNELNATLDKLKSKRIIKNRRDVITDFLAHLLRHTKSELESAGFDDSYNVEMVLCVPAIWSQKACREMQTAMAQAMGRAGFKGVDVKNNSVDNLFIVSEPEAAASFVLTEQSDISPGDTFVLLDAGGGTVDANTYTVSATTPLRLTREVVPPGGGLYGSSYINEEFRKLLRDALAEETYLQTEDSTIQGCIEKIMIHDFEYRIKRTFNCFKPDSYKQFDVPGLRARPDKDGVRFGRGSLQIDSIKIRDIFAERLDGVATIMEDQLRAALERVTKVEKILPIGGFAKSKSFREYLRRRLARFCAAMNCPMPELLNPPNTATAVARGAVLRAFNKELGPRRYARSSYGILRTEPYNDFPEHRWAKKSFDRHDGQAYAVDTVDWVLKLGQEVEPVWKCEPFKCFHTFDCWPPRPLICREILLVSDTSRDSHYQLKHPRNAGAEKVGEIVVDFTDLRDRGVLQPIDGGENEKGKRVGKRHYKVEYTMVIKVVDRDLQCYAIYGQEVRKKCKINIASAFRPGVK